MEFIIREPEWWDNGPIRDCPPYPKTDRHPLEIKYEYKIGCKHCSKMGTRNDWIFYLDSFEELFDFFDYYDGISGFELELEVINQKLYKVITLKTSKRYYWD